MSPPDVATAVGEFRELLANYRELPPDEVRAPVCRLWPAIPSSGHFCNNEVLALFRWMWFCGDGAERPYESITVYRGQFLAYEDSGFSWTIDHAVAHFYATVYSEDNATCCLQASVPRRAVLARFAIEDEVIIDPSVPFTTEIHCRHVCLKRPDGVPRVDRVNSMKRRAESTNCRSWGSSTSTKAAEIPSN